MFEDYYGLPYDNFNLLDFLLASGISPSDPALAGRFRATVPVEQPSMVDRIPSEPVFVPSAEPVYTPPTLLPAAPEPAPVEPVYTLPTPQPVVAEPAPVEPVYTRPVEPVYTPLVEPEYTRFVEPPFVPSAEPVFVPPTLLPAAPEPAPVEPVYTLPTPQPIAAEPAPVEPVYTLPTLQPVVAEPIAPEPRPVAEPAVQSLPTEQPVVTAPVEPDWASMTDWNPGMLQQGPFGVLADTGPAYDPNMVFRFDTGNKIGVPNEQGGFTYQNAAPVVFQPGEQYVLTNKSGDKVLGRATTPEEMQKLVNMSSEKGDWSLYRADASGNIVPGSQLFSKNESLSLGSMLPYMAAVAGTAFGLNALGLGAASAGGAGAGAMPSIGSALADVGSQLAGTSFLTVPTAAAAGTTAALGGTAAGGAIAAAAPIAGEIVVPGYLASSGIAALAPAAAATAGTLGAALAAAQPGPVNYGDQVYNEAPQTYDGAEIVAEAPRITPPVTPPPLSIGDIATLAPLVPPITSIPNVDVPMQELPAEPPAPEPEIVVEAPRQPPITIEDIMTLPAATTLAPNTSTITEPSTLQPEAPQDNLLRDIMRYYSLGSGILDALGVGQGGGAAAPATPYTPVLGAVPTFGRGQFQPFTGDYETYAMGPEWSFFNQPTQTAPANAQFPFLLPPATPSA